MTSPPPRSTTIRNEISICLSGGDFSAVRSLANDLVRLPNWQICLDWRDDENGVGMGLALNLIAWERKYHCSEPGIVLPVLVHDRDAIGFAHLQIMENRRLLSL